MSVSVLIKNCAQTVGEGPHWDPVSQCLYHVDIHAGDVFKWDYNTGINSKIHFDDTVGFVIPRKSGGFLIGLGQTVSHFNWGSNKHTVLAKVDEGKETRLNDAKCDASGRLWCGTMSTVQERSQWPKGVGGFYSLDKDLTLRKQLDKIDISNGLAWSSNNKTFYYIDSMTKKVAAYDFDIKQGKIDNQRVAVNLSDEADGVVPDGMCIDTEGMLWVACIRASKIVRFNPVTGESMRIIEFPTSAITSCCFGGPNMDELFVTCAKFDQNKDEPLVGSVFKVTGLGVKGPEANIFQG